MAEKEFEMTVVEGSKENSGAGIEPANHNSTAMSGSSTQRLDRYIKLKPAVAFGLTVLSSWEGIGLTMASVMLNGGPTAMVYGTILTAIGTLCIACSLGELASITPAVGAQYRWTGLYAPRSMSPAFWSLLQGWITVLSWIGLCTAVSFSCAICIQGLVILNNESYVPERWHATLLMWAYLLIPFCANVFARKILAVVEIIGGILHIIFFIVTIVTLATTAKRSTPEFVFTTSFFGNSGWESEGVQWCIGLLSIGAVLAGFDGVLHLSDEIVDAPRKVPKAMWMSVLINSIMAFGYLITILFCIGDVDAVLTTPTGFPMIEIYYQATRSKAGATVLVCMILLSTTISLFGVSASVSRLTWAFARDNGLPFSKFFTHVHPTLRVPLRAVGLVFVVAALLGLINIGSTAAFGAFLSLATVGLYLSYCIPLFFVLIRKLEGNPPVYGPFSLGKWSIPVNIVGLLFGIFFVIFLPFPPMQPVTAVNMNYAGPILGAVILVAIGDWFISGHKRFVVPTSKEMF